MGKTNTNEIALLNNALANIEVTTELIESPDFADNYALLLAYIEQANNLKDAINAKIKEALEQAYMTSGVQTVKNGKYSYTYKPATTRESVDTKRLKTEMPDVYKNFVKISDVKSSVTATLIKDKAGE